MPPLNLMHRLRPECALVLVGRIDLVDQWIAAGREHLGIEIGRIGDGDWDEQRISVATWQTISKRMPGQDWFDKFSMVIVDEAHHAAAPIMSDVVARFPSRYRLGLSATPKASPMFDVARNVLGEVFFQHHDLPMKPTVEVVPTHMRAPSPDNWNALLDNLCWSPTRNGTIADKVAEYMGHRQIIVSNRTKHLDAIGKALDKQDIEWQSMTGRDPAWRRRNVKEWLTDNPNGVVLTTVGDEGLDIPNLEIMHLPCPERQGAKKQQQVGRVARTADGKTTSLVVDYVDIGLEWMFGLRRRAYDDLGLDIVGVERLNFHPNGRAKLGGGLF
jgi:superfamily II DNA or RNA helicase